MGCLELTGTAVRDAISVDFALYVVVTFPINIHHIGKTVEYVKSNTTGESGLGAKTEAPLGRPLGCVLYCDSNNR